MGRSESTRTKARGFGILRSALLALICLVSVTSANTPGSAAHQAAAAEAAQLIAQVDKLNYDGKYLEAVPLAEKAVAIRERIFGKEHVETAAALDTLCYTYRFAGMYKEAKAAIERALPIRERELGPNHLETARSLNNMGAMHYWFGEYDQAEKQYRRSLDIRQHSLGLAHLDTTISMANLGELYVIRGSFEKGEKILRQVLAIREQVFGESPATADALVRLGYTLIQLGDFSESERLYLRGISMFERLLGPNHPSLVSPLLNLGHLAFRLGAYKRCEALLLRALKIREASLHDQNLINAGTLNQLGILYARIGDFSKAKDYFERAGVVGVNAVGTTISESGGWLNNLGELNISMGNYNEARQILMRSLEAKKFAIGDKHPRYAITLKNLGTAYSLQGQLNLAKDAFERALEIQDQSLGRFHFFTTQTLISLAALNWQRQNTQLALKYFERAYQSHLVNSSRILEGNSETHNQEYIRTLADDTHALISFAVSGSTNARVDLGLAAALLYKVRALDYSSSNHESFRDRVDGRSAALFDEQTRVVSEISKLVYLQENKLLVQDAYRARVASLEKTKDAIDARLSRVTPNSRILPSRIDGARLRNALPSHSALIEWIKYHPFDPAQLGVNGLPVSRLSPAHYAAFIVRKDKETVAIDVGDAESADAAVNRFRQSLAQPQERSFEEIDIFKLLFAPIEKHLDGVNQLIISPDDVLSLVPFAAITDADGKTLARRYEISYVTSGRDLLKAPRSSTTSTNAIVLANPLFGNVPAQPQSVPISAKSERSRDLDRGGLIFRSLDQSEAEAQELGRLLGPSSTVLTGENATEAALKNVHAPSVLHIASHGFFLSNQEFRNDVWKHMGEMFDLPVLENPLLRSGLALAGANERKSGTNEDGILTALEATQLDLSGTELVVLSACDTGLGDVRNGEGVYGLRRALVLAGAETQVTSLWKVSDEATRILMVNFYERLMKGEGRSEALRHAQLELMDNPKYSHPYYWASFIPIGDWTPLKSIQKNQTVAKTH